MYGVVVPTVCKSSAQGIAARGSDHCFTFLQCPAATVVQPTSARRHRPRRHRPQNRVQALAKLPLQVDALYTTSSNWPCSPCRRWSLRPWTAALGSRLVLCHTWCNSGPITGRHWPLRRTGPGPCLCRQTSGAFLRAVLRHPCTDRGSLRDPKAVRCLQNRVPRFHNRQPYWVPELIQLYRRRRLTALAPAAALSLILPRSVELLSPVSSAPSECMWVSKAVCP